MISTRSSVVTPASSYAASEWCATASSNISNDSDGTPNSTLPAVAASANNNRARTCPCTRATKSGALSTSRGTTTAPLNVHPKNAATHSAPLPAHTNTRSPFPTPRASNSRANLHAVPATRPYDHRTTRTPRRPTNAVSRPRRL
jgi:hypothetical protein